MTDLMKSLKAALYERATSPIFGFFVMSWGIINWKLISIYLFSSKPMIEKIKVIESSYYNPENLFYKPVITAAILFFVYQFISLWTYEFWAFINNKKIQIKKKNSDEVQLSLEKSIELKGKMLDQEEKYLQMVTEAENELKQTTKENEALLKKLNNLQKSHNELNEQIKNINQNVSQEHLKSKGSSIEEKASELEDEYIDEFNDKELVEKFKKNIDRGSEQQATHLLIDFLLVLLKDYESLPSSVLKDALIKVSDYSKIRVEKFLNEMISENYIIYNEGYYQLNFEGKDYLLSNKMDNLSFKDYMAM